MKLPSALVGVCLVALSWPAAMAQSQDKPIASQPDSKSAPYKLKDITLEFRQQVLKSMAQTAQLRQLLLTAPVLCVLQGDKCRVPVQLIQVTDGTETYCVGLLPEVVTLQGTSGANSTKRIVWELIPPDPPVANAEFFFHDESDHGIIWLSNFGSPLQLHNGTLGDGSIGSPDRTRFVVRNRHRIKGEGVYVPIILQKDTTTGKIALCGTPDPRMVND
jgi:hypothetical protein